MSSPGDSVHEYMLSRVRLFETPWIIAHQASLSMEFTRQEYWSGLPFPPPEDFPHPGIKTHISDLLHWQVDSLPLGLPGKPSQVILMHAKIWEPLDSMLTKLSFLSIIQGFPGCSDSKESACNGGDRVWFLGGEDPLEKGMVTHSSIPAWRIPWTEEAAELHTVHGVTKSRTQLSD